MHFTHFAKSAAASLLFMLGFVLPAHAQNNKPISSGTWYEDRAIFSNGSNILTLTFAQAPTDKFLNITNVACDIETSLGYVLGRVALGASTSSGGSGDLGRSQSIRGASPPEISVSTRYYSIVTQPYLKLGPGRFPFIQISIAIQTTGATASLLGDCVIVGNLTDN
jgi:hypothetical protein